MAEFFRSRPPAQPARQTFPVCRSGGKWTLNVAVIALSDRVTCAATHYSGRTRPCMEQFGKKCESCEAGWEPRWVGYFAAWHIQRKQKVVVELTATAADLLAAHAEKVGSIRGQLIRLSRLGDRKNGPLEISWQHSNTPADQLPASFDVEDVLRRLWRINQALKTGEQSPKTIAGTITPEDPRISGDFRADEFRHKNNGHSRSAKSEQ